MVNQLVIILGIGLFSAICLIIYKKPEIIKKDVNKKLSIGNFSLKKTFIGDWKSFGTWMLLMFLVLSYAHDTSECRKLLSNLDEVCAVHMGNMMYIENTAFKIDELNLTGDYNRTTISWGGDKPGSSSTLSSDS